ncbi:hypothetical protein QLX08_010316 [Tetragonisca angustula]|uniref:Uncharacterized protein n=1 Tax=Tetragonisca angustula TaxID=166442 RepID=A0AAW0ZCQ6_9HYME
MSSFHQSLLRFPFILRENAPWPCPPYPGRIESTPPRSSGCFSGSPPSLLPLKCSWLPPPRRSGETPAFLSGFSLVHEAWASLSLFLQEYVRSRATHTYGPIRSPSSAPYSISLTIERRHIPL